MWRNGEIVQPIVISISSPIPRGNIRRYVLRSSNKKWKVTYHVANVNLQLWSFIDVVIWSILKKMGNYINSRSVLMDADQSYPPPLSVNDESD